MYSEKPGQHQRSVVTSWPAWRGRKVNRNRTVNKDKNPVYSEKNPKYSEKSPITHCTTKWTRTEEKQTFARFPISIFVGKRANVFLLNNREPNYGVAVCCSMLQRVALCCRVLQCVAVHCSGYFRVEVEKLNSSIFFCVSGCFFCLRILQDNLIEMKVVKTFARSLSLCLSLSLSFSLSLSPSFSLSSLPR